MRNADLAVVVAIWLCLSLQSRGQTVSNGSFETPAQLPNSFVYDPSGATWSFTANAGIINAPGGAFFGPSAPGGNQYAFLQSGNAQGSFAQSITFSLGGTFQLSYAVAGRSSNGAGAFGNLGYQVLLDSTVIESDATATGQAFTARSFDFTTASGNHTLTFAALPSGNGGDDTGFFDVVGIQPVPEPAVSVFVLSAICGFALVRRCRSTAWTKRSSL